MLKLLPLLKVETFKNARTLEQEAFMAKFTNEWYTKPVAQGRFKKEDLLNAATVYGLGDKSTSITPQVAALTGSCNCRYDIGCDTNYYCRRVTCTANVDCGIVGTSKCVGICS